MPDFATLEWDEGLATGVELVDEQHRRLVDLVNELGRALETSHAFDADGIEAVFARLADHVRDHFSAEERLMLEREVAFEHRFLHAREHQDFLAQVSAMWRSRDRMSNPAQTIHAFLSAWIAQHVVGVDQEMARQLELIRAGYPAAEACEVARGALDARSSLLFAAARNAYRVLADQNRDLLRSGEELGERVRELRCLNLVQELVSRADLPFERVLAEAVLLLPPACAHPEIACARIACEGREHETPGFRNTPFRLAAPIAVAGETVGCVEVCYLEERPGRDDGPFLAEERTLVDAVALKIAGRIRQLRADEALHRSEERWREILRAALDGFWRLDARGRIAEVNDAYSRMSGWTEGELLGKPASFVEASETADATAARMERLVAVGLDRFETRHRRKDGSPLDLDVSAQFHREEGEIVAFLRDVTGR